MSRAVFVAGTGTDIGKTYFCSLLVKKLREEGMNAGYYKPALSGALRENGRLIPGDALEVLTAAGIGRDPAEVVGYLFEEAVSPHLAARRRGTPIRPGKIVADLGRLSREYDLLTVEGCGGLLCPLGLDEEVLLLADLIRSLSLGVILVADAGLGTINATLLTLEAAHARCIPVRAVVLNRFEPGNFLHEDNERTLARLAGAPVWRCETGADNLNLSLVKLLECYK